MDKWGALVCGDTCTVVSSSATETTPDPFVPELGIATFDSFVPTAAASSEYDLLPIVVGDGIARLEENGEWTVLIPPGTGSTFLSAYALGTDTILAVGQDGRVTLYDYGGICEIKSDINGPFIAVWARWFLGGSPVDYELIIHAFTENGQALFTDADSAVMTCGFAAGVRAAFLAGGSVVAVSSDGLIYATGRTVYEHLQCSTGKFEGDIVSAKSYSCGILPNIIGWNESAIFADPEIHCAIE
jgi:hypothetical protein